MAGITINKVTGNAPIKLDNNDIIQKMNERVDVFCKALLTDSDKFKREDAFEDLFGYISMYDRILYAPISNTIYACYDGHEVDEAAGVIGTMNTNIMAVVDYSQGAEIEKRIKEAESDEVRQNLIDTKKAILKIWDHVNLAQQQYSVLKQSDEDYRKKFDRSITPFKEELTKDVNSQLLTMVSIFTALAFLVFGGISSLDNIFSNSGLPVLKLMMVGSVWGLCILNLIFVFLFCVGKMTKLNFKSTDDETADIFQKYPIVWWSDFIIIAIMGLSGWGYYLTKKNIHTWFDKICLNYPFISTIIGTGAILALIAFLGCKLMKATNHTNGKES